MISLLSHSAEGLSQDVMGEPQFGGHGGVRRPRTLGAVITPSEIGPSRRSSLAICSPTAHSATRFSGCSCRRTTRRAT